jgi:glycosyltransferase involved in cell wall biosynthesis
MGAGQVSAGRRGAERAEAGGVLCVANFASNTGYAWRLVERLWARLAGDAAAAGARTFVAFPRLNGVSPALAAAPLEVVELPLPTGSARAPRGLREFIRDHDIRLVYLTDRACWSTLYAQLRRWGVRCIVLHDHIPGERPAPPGWKLLAKRMRYRVPGCSADLYIGVSDFVRERFTHIAGVPAGRCVTLRNGVAPAAASARDVRAVFRLPPDAQVIVSCSRATYYKGIDFLIRCAGRLVHAEGRERVHFVHLGDGPDLPAFRREVQERRLEGRFHLPGREDDVPSLLASCTLAAHASHGEAFSLAILEFMAAGLPAVVPAHCGNGEAIRHGEDGALYPPGDLDAAVAWLGRLLDDEPLRRRLGATARTRAEEEFSLEAMETRFSALVRPCISLAFDAAGVHG